MNKVNQMKEKLHVFFLKRKYKSKARKLNITDNMLSVLANRYNIKEVPDILNLIAKSKDFNDFKNNLVSYIENHKSIYMSYQFLLGMITGKYSFVDLNFIDTEKFNFHNFLDNDYRDSLHILREHFYDYLMNNNQLKNQFLIDNDGKLNYNLDLDRGFCERVFDECVSGREYMSYNSYLDCSSVVRDYILKMVGIYGKENIDNNIDFVLYDANQKSNVSLEERKEQFQRKANLNSRQLGQIQNVNLLIKKLKTIPNEEAKELLTRVNEIKNDIESHLEELSDIYIEYEIILRNDIVNHLYEPTDRYTVIEDFHNLKPQLLHLFLRDPSKFKGNLEDKILKEIIENRSDKRNHSEELTEEEKIEFEKRKQSIDISLNPTQVNYSYDGSSFMYSDKDGFRRYHSDTNNQLSTSIYSANYYLKNFSVWNIGIGFNHEGLSPEAIALSSSQYLTTNMGLNNLEYEESEEFRLLSASYSELIENDGKSEVLLFRRNMDYDTKASYVFLTIDSSQKDKSEEYLKKAKEMADKNQMKLVVYDLYKIKQSYVAYLEKETNVENENRISRNR